MEETPPTDPPLTALQRATAAMPYLLVAGAFGLLVYCIARGGEPFNVSDEEGLMETGTIVFFFICALIAGVALRANRATLRRAERVFLVVFIIIMFVGIGEELSWGQRIGGWDVPEVIAAERGGLIQAGHEDTALHNLSFKSRYLRVSVGGMLFGIVLIAALAAHGIWLPIAHRKGERFATWLVKRTGVFVPPLKLGILVTVAAAMLHYSKPFDATAGREYKECVIPAVYAFMMLGVYFGGRRAVDRRMRMTVIALLAVWVSVQMMIEL